MAHGHNGHNFYYGAPAPYAESIAPSHHSTYAHYYDDEEDGWDMPNFYNEGYMKVSSEYIIRILNIFVFYKKFNSKDKEINKETLLKFQF